MPNRMLRDWTQSERVNDISIQAELFFVRLIMKVDDYGCFYANTALLKANLFPLKLKKIKDTDITSWLKECEKAGMIIVYKHDGKQYLQIKDFRQRLDRSKSKFPLPNENQNVDDFRDSVNDLPPEVEEEVEEERETEGARVVFINPFGNNFLAWQGWKNYKREEHRENYRSVKTENAAIQKLFSLSNGNPEIAMQIIQQSIENRWKGLFEIKKLANGNTKKTGFTRSGVQSALSKRLDEIQQAGG